ncbi:hypothetical protein KKF84_22045 [Myxococcota bacterium]|nr:hypothetical protein [Myxococcota bacterium]
MWFKNRISQFFASTPTWVIALVFFLFSLTIHLAVSWERCTKASANNHFAYQAQVWLKGRLDLPKAPPHGNDWALVTTLSLKDGRTLRGSFWHSRGNTAFRTTHGTFVTVRSDQILRRKRQWYVSFPPMPAILMVPFVAIWGTHFNDVIFTIVFASANGVLLWLLLLALGRRGFHKRTRAEALSLSLLFLFGSVHFFSAVRGEVWFTAHILGVFFALLYLLSLFDHRFFMAGLALGAAALCRTPFVFAALLVPFVTYRKEKVLFSMRTLKPLLRFGIPFAFLLILAMIHNWARFDNPFEFGHYYLNIRWRGRMERYGLFSLEYLSRNLSVALTLLPRLKTTAPFIQISPHGMALWLTTPIFFALIRFRGKHPLAIPMAVVILPMALMALLYQNSGFVQFGYRFSIDYSPLLILLLAFSHLRFGRLYYALLGYSVAINLFGAITFARHRQYYPPGSFLFFMS